MSQISIKEKAPLKGEIAPPSDKSISHRAIILAALANGRSIIRNFLQAEDPLRTLQAFRQMGVEIEEKTPEREIIIHGKGLDGLKEPADIIDCGNSGTTMRLLSGVLAGQSFTSTLTGDKYLLRRPMQRIIKPLAEMGALITSENSGYPPLKIKGGGLKPINYISPVASAQVKSAILFAGLYCEGLTTVTEPEKSRDHTERMLGAAGVDIKVGGLKVGVKGRAALKPMEITVPGDFSSAAFFMVAGSIIPGSEILIKNTGINPTRTGLMDILKMMGADIRFHNMREVSGEPVADISVNYAALGGIEVGGEMVLRAIDEFPILCVAAAKAKGTTRITGAGELRVKESDRIASMAAELRKMGVSIEELEDGLIIEGRERLNAAVIQSHGDHRIAMAMLIAGLTAEGETRVEDIDCVNTSFPGFVEMLKGLMKR
ncbi:MAG: 3-phosphoshikimate 1-carboxyvinyltransferase [Nitrospirae bacterium]|nr:3-phosphoshikimate 1-carboxyvinyltransferase [Nitrospirota bacterium]